jgi:formylglycine-generating enzyme required for sulfatase activity
MGYYDGISCTSIQAESPRAATPDAEKAIDRLFPGICTQAVRQDLRVNDHWAIIAGKVGVLCFSNHLPPKGDKLTWQYLRVLVVLMVLSSLHSSVAGDAADTAAKEPMLVAPFTREKAIAAQKECSERLGSAVDITNSIGMKLKLIPAGESKMGSPASDKADSDERPRHKVRLTRPFYLGVTEVTQGQWKAVMKTEPWSGEDCVKEGLDYAATHVSSLDAIEFCKRLSAKDGMTYRLPTEAEFEYACRGGTTSVYHFGDDASRLGDYAWHEGNAYDGGEKYAHEVARKKPNPFGLYDMHGNVWEWCSDWYSGVYYGESPVADPKGPALASRRVYRGGSWLNPAWFCRSAYRYGNPPDARYNDLGFRVAADPSGK